MTQERYQKIDRIAIGGMGEVWRARDTMLGREVALKVLKPEFASDATFRTRFADEARHAAALKHPGIASVYDVGEDAGVPFLVMELVDGQPLSALIRPGQPMSPDAARSILAQAADAVAAAHAAGVIHRDVKPANLLVTPNGTVKVTDFGIARAVGSASITQTGQIMGSPHYLSPEQAEGTTATKASDVYSLGVVLYECLTGNRPFDGESAVATALAHIRQEPPPLPDTAPADLAAICRKAMAKDPAQRFPDAAAMAAALHGDATALSAVPNRAASPAAPTGATTQVLGTQASNTPAFGTGTLAPTPPPPSQEPEQKSRAALWVLVAVAAIAAIGLLLWQPWQDKSPEPITPTDTPSISESPTESPTVEIVSIDENDYLGRTYADASSRLQDLGMRTFQAGTVSNDGSNDPGTVASLTTSGQVPKGTRIGLKLYGAAPSTPEPSPTPTKSVTPTPTPTPTVGDAPGDSNGG